jgi:hypothetical protein
MWKPYLECTLTLERIWKESLQRGAKFEVEYGKLCERQCPEHKIKRMRYLRENILRFKYRAQTAFLELATRKHYRSRIIDL